MHFSDQHTPYFLDDFAVVGEKILAALPEPFRTRLHGVEIRVADFPEGAALRQLGLDHPFDLLGLFEGIGLAHDSAVPETGRPPNRIWLYRQPILHYWTQNPEETLDSIIAHVLIHEIGHHFGLSDDDIEAIENAA